MERVDYEGGAKVLKALSLSLSGATGLETIAHLPRKSPRVRCARKARRLAMIAQVVRVTSSRWQIVTNAIIHLDA